MAVVEVASNPIAELLQVAQNHPDQETILEVRLPSRQGSYENLQAVRYVVAPTVNGWSGITSRVYEHPNIEVIQSEKLTKTVSEVIHQVSADVALLTGSGRVFPVNYTVYHKTPNTPPQRRHTIS